MLAGEETLSQPNNSGLNCPFFLNHITFLYLFGSSKEMYEGTGMAQPSSLCFPLLSKVTCGDPVVVRENPFYKLCC